MPKGIALLLVVLLTGCGFQLRGSLNLPPDWQSLHLQTQSPNSELSRAMRDGAERAGIEWTNRGDANYVVYLGDERFQRRNLTIGANATAAEFELEMVTKLRVTDSAGNELLPETEVRTRQIITNNAQNITGKVEETRLLRNEMRNALVREMLRQLRFLAENNPGGVDSGSEAPAGPASGL